MIMTKSNEIYIVRREPTQVPIVFNIAFVLSYCHDRTLFYDTAHLGEYLCCNMNSYNV